MTDQVKHALTAIAIFSLMVIGLTPLAVYLAYELSFRHRVYPGVRLSDTFSRVAASSVTLRYPADHTDTLATQRLEVAKFDIQVDTLATQEALRSVGRSGHFFRDVETKIQAYRNGVSVEPILVYDRQLVEEAVTSLAATVDKPTIEPKFRLSEGRVREFRPGVPGRAIDRKLLTNRIIAAVLQPVSPTSSEATDRIVDVPITTHDPLVTDDNLSAESLGIRQLLGRGISTFKGSIPGRKYNIVLTASRIDGVLIPPGATFSFNDTIGDVSQATGYREAYIIKDGRTILGDGGGVCQDSTTLFRAVLNAGLPITERHAHSYRVGYYEQNSPPGFDATVFAPSVDLKFQNDTPAYILLQVQVNQVTDTLTAELWGTSDGRVATTTKPIIKDQIPPPADLYQDDPSLPAGQIKQVDWKAWGANVSFDYTVTRAGETIYQKTFRSNYRPWQAVFQRGTGEQP